MIQKHINTSSQFKNTAMKLDVFANNFLGGSGQSGNLLDNPRFDKLNNALGGFKNANPMLITTMWQTLLESPDLSNKLYPEAVSNTSSNPFLNHIEKFLLCLGNNKYCLLVFDPSITSDEPIHIDASKNNTEKSEWPMIICKPPKRVFTCYFPTTPHKVYLKDGEAFRSLAGVYTKNSQGIFGVTICLHCFPNSYVEAGITKVKINGIAGTVISVHNISDSCFVQLDATEAQISDLLNAKGPLQGTTPREFENCYFINLLSGMSSLGGVSFISTALPYVKPLEDGIALLTGSSDDTILEIGLNTELDKVSTGYFVVIRANKNDIDADNLIIDKRDFRLVNKNGSAIENYPYMVFEISAAKFRDDWFNIPDVSLSYNKLREEVQKGNYNDASDALKAFKRIVYTSPDLLLKDAKSIYDKVEIDINDVLKAIQTRSTNDFSLRNLSEFNLQ